MDRVEQLRAWVADTLAIDAFDLAPASSDASFRRYFRATANARHYIVMDAPPAHEDCRPYIHVAKLFGGAGVHVPEVLAQNLEDGFLLLSDLGSTTYLAALDAASARELYLAANAALLDIQAASRPGVLPDYDRALLLREMNLFPEWYVGRHLGRALDSGQQAALAGVFETLLANNLAQPRVWVHRDYHSRNLMVSEPNPGVLDFQDAVYGPLTYDLVSLYKDAYIRWDEELVLDWVIRYWERAKQRRLPVDTDFHAFYRDFEWMGVQRHLKVLGIFARLWHRDGKEGYLKDLPRVFDYVKKTCERYTELRPLLGLLNELEGRTPQVGCSF